MTSPVSIGDALLLAKIAWKLGKAFTKGRKSSISEFREVESQLYALSTALSALHNSRLTQNGDDSNALSSMLENCRGTLSHLEAIVDQYGSLGETRDDTGAPVFKRWSSRLQRDWRAIKWTTEGGDLAKMRSELMVHINSLNLFMSVTSNLQFSRTSDQLVELMAMTRRIYILLEENRRREIVNPTSPGSLERSAPELFQQLTFHLYIQSASENKLICDHASIHPSWTLRTPRATNQPSEVARDIRPFVCGCQAEGTHTTTIHQYELDAFTLSPFSFAIREAGPELSWLLYKMSDMHNNKQTSLVIKSVHPTRLMDFEVLFIQALSVERATQMLKRNLHTDLAYTITNADGNNEAHILSLISDVAECSKLIDMITFSANSKTYTRKDVKEVDILHYRKAEFSILQAPERARSFVPNGDAEIVLRYSHTDGEFGDEDIPKMTLCLTHNTVIRYDAEKKNVAFLEINCKGSDSVAFASNVEIYFLTSQAALEFRNRCEHMRTELFILSLKFPRPYETSVLRLQAGAVDTEDISIAESEITIAQDSRTGAFRLIVVSHDGRTVLSQRLARDFMGSENSGPNFRSLTWVIQINEHGRLRQRRYQNGFEYIVLSDICAQEIFKLWAHSQLPGSPGMAPGRYLGATRQPRLLS